MSFYKPIKEIFICCPCRPLLLLLFHLALFSSLLDAQTFSTINFTGEIKDEFGGLIVGAEISLTDTKQKTFTTTSSKSGSFNLTNLKTGLYKLKISATGFSQHEKTIELHLRNSKPHSIILYSYD